MYKVFKYLYFHHTADPDRVAQWWRRPVYIGKIVGSIPTMVILLLTLVNCVCETGQAYRTVRALRRTLQVFQHNNIQPPLSTY
jgi:hypothetical protein